MTRNSQILLMIILGWLLPSTIIGQNLSTKTDHKVILKSEILKEDRSILIHLPDKYDDSNKTYPVLFRLDGSTDLMLQTVAVVNRLTYRDDISPEVIIVAIENTSRSKNMWPTNNKYYPEPNVPGAKDFQSFIEKELIPYIEDNYRISQEKIISGRSLSSLFVLYSLLTKPDIFDYYIANSGGFPESEEYFNALYDDASEQPEKLFGKKVFITNGLKDPLDADGRIHQQMLDFSEKIKKDIGDSIFYKYLAYKDEGHVPANGLYDGLKFVFSTNKN